MEEQPMIRLLKTGAAALALALLIGLAGQAAAEETKGKVQVVTADKNEFVLRDMAGVYRKFFVPRDCKVFVNNREVRLADLQKGDQVYVVYGPRGLLPLVANEIHCARQ
jgi:hypothetical protein